MNSQTVESLNRPLKIAIIDSGLTQRRLSKRARIEVTRLSRIVRGRIAPEPHEQKALARVLGHPVTDLFTDVAAV